MAADRPCDHAALGLAGHAGERQRRGHGRGHAASPVHRRALRKTCVAGRLRFSVPPQAAPVPHRLPRGRAAAGFRLLRPAGLGVAADEPAGHRQGRRAGQPLGVSGAAVLCRWCRRRLALVVGLDVRVPDAHAGARRALRQRAARRLPHSDARADRIRRGAGRALGNFRVGLRRERPHAGLPVRAAGRAPARSAPHPARRTGDRAVRHRAGGADRTAPRLPQFFGAAGTGAARTLRLHRGARLLAGASLRHRRVHPSPHLHGAPPGHEHRGAGQRVARRRGAALGHGQPVDRSGVVAAARARAARGVDAVHAGVGPAASGTAAARTRPAARGAARCGGAGADARAVERALQRVTARQRRRCQPLGRLRHHPLARRRAARCARQLLLLALGPAAADGIDHPAPCPRPGRALPQHVPRRPRLLRSLVGATAGAHHGVGQPRGRH